MCLVQRDWIGRGRQEVATFANQGLQAEFKGLSIKQNNWTRIPYRPGGRFQVKRFDEGACGLVKGSGIEIDFDVSAVVPGSVVGLGRCLWLRESADRSLLLHRAHFFRL